jgi:hypothetical protein
MRIVLLAALSLITACKRDEPPARTPVADARVAAPADAPPRADAPPAPPTPIDAPTATDAQPVDAGPARPKPRPAPDAAPPPAPDAAVEPAKGACRRTEFDTKLVADACASGGQAAAKAAMKKWVRTAKKQESKLECKSCHEKLSPDYPLKDDALEHFKRLGGE